MKLDISKPFTEGDVAIHFFDTVNPHVLKSGDLDSENKTVQVKDGTVLIPVVAKKNVPGRVNRKQANSPKPLKTK